MEDVVSKLESELEDIDFEDMNNTSWYREEGILISGNEAKKIIEFYNKHKDHE